MLPVADRACRTLELHLLSCRSYVYMCMLGITPEI